MSNRYWTKPLGEFYSNFYQRLFTYLLVGTAYAASTYITTIIVYGPAWLLSDLAHITVYALHTALVFAGSLAVIDITASRLDKARLGYSRRTVGRQWLVMFAGFVLAYSLFRITFHQFSEFYGAWLLGHDQVLMEEPSEIMHDLLFFFFFWLLIAHLSIQFALWNQPAAEEPPGRPARNGVPQDTAGELRQDSRDDCLTLHNQNQDLRLPFGEITHVTVEDHYCRLYHKKGNELVSHMIRMPLKQLESNFPQNHFARIHRSHLVNLKHVLGWRQVGQQRRLVMDLGIEELPISLHRFRQMNHIVKTLKRYGSGQAPTPAYKDISSGQAASGASNN